ncbi:MAG: glyoxalase/bleomycin resistance/dioxygenase family protein [Gammaproteobacteria bacterium]|nr:glyoxalase/bleomycin resistance/dioxygenase family protein [Gammaproteobacteria bacterium]
MKRLHIHIGVDDLAQGISFYSAFFSTEPAKIKSDYAKWQLDDPRLNFAISTRSGRRGVDHLGIQVDQAAELNALRTQLSASGLTTADDGETECCYARSDKSWIQDPAGTAWEIYTTMDDAELFHSPTQSTDQVCCTPESKGTPGCCEPSPATAGCCD